MTTYEIKDLSCNSCFSDDVFLDTSFLLMTPSNPLTRELMNALNTWDFSQVISKGHPLDFQTQLSKGGAVSATDLAKATATEAKKSQALKAVSSNFEEITDFDNFLDDINKKPQTPPAPQPAPSTVAPSTTTKLAPQQTQQTQQPQKATNPVSEGESEINRIKIVQGVYYEYLNYITKVYTHYATHKELNYQELSKIVRDFCIYIKDNRRYVLRINPPHDDKKYNFLVLHAMKSTVLSLSIGLQLKLPLTQLIELGIATILHEIGMIKLPPQLYMADRVLSPQEKAQLNQHPVMSFQIVKEAGFPVSIQLGVLDHHEKENGTGYPRHIDGSKISVYGKIISIACTYEAITAPRAYKESKTTFAGMVELLNNKDRSYSQTVIMALVQCLSLYPIGSYVYLSNGKIALVVDAVAGSPKTPIVQILGEKSSDGTYKTIQVDGVQLKVTRVLNKIETQDLLKNHK